MADKQVTPFQLTDQFTMENFNQRIEETNTLLQNNDPRNWGLGANAKLLTSADNLDNIKENGWYWWYDSIPSGAKDEYCHMRVDNGQSVVTNTITQTIYRNGLNDVTVRYYKGDTWITEYINPPMALGVEYRTTERFNGHPVYKRAVNIGDITGDGKSTFASNGATTVLSGELLYNGYLPFNFIHERNLSSSWTRYANVTRTSSTIEVSYYIGSSYGTSSNTIVILRYLKD